ncbi:MAG: GTPase ObgE [Planctomycetota bacterium]|nr:MAG: GTPase ObgE [Planctomycetota bacterium]
MFVDRAVIFVRGGDGGSGCSSFRREKYIPLGGPDGGDGGKGGSVILIAMSDADSLAEVGNKKHWRANGGEKGGTSNCTGSDAKDIIIHVPPGTLVYDRDRGNLLKDLVTSGDSVVIAKGGKGGRGNRSFANSINRAPRIFSPGEIGEERWLMLELKAIADVGLVGLPNAGKSTLLSRLSRATPEIADYPFTTKQPNLGMVLMGQDHGFVLADLPGLIEGASEGLGLGHEFLRHVERTKVLVHLVEPLPMDESDPVENYKIVHKELLLHGQGIENKPEIILISKAEIPESAEVRDRMEKETGKKVMCISSVTGQGLQILVRQVVETLGVLKSTSVA